MSISVLPSGADIKVKRNTEAVTGRAYVTIINWPAIGGIPHNEISFDQNADGPILTNGDLFQILNAQNPFGAPVLRHLPGRRPLHQPLGPFYRATAGRESTRGGDCVNAGVRRVHSRKGIGPDEGGM